MAVLAVLIANNVLIGALVCCFSHPVLTHDPAWYPINFLATAIYLFGEALAEPEYFFKLVFHWQPMLWVSLGTLISIAAGSYYKIR